MIKKIFTRLDAKIPGIYSLYSFFVEISSIPRLLKDYFYYRKTSNTSREFKPRFWSLKLCVKDSTSKTGFDAHYIYHPAWAARRLQKLNPKKHTDIGSIMHFGTIISAFIEIDFYDYRPSDIHLSNYSNKHADLLNLPFNDNSIESLSCMHTIEHIGLGRYGDPIDYDGDIKGIRELIRVLEPGGTLIFVTPVGKPRIEFNAHRIYSYKQILSYFTNLDLIEFSMLSDDISNGIIVNADPNMVKDQNYACGCFIFKKKTIDLEV